MTLEDFFTLTEMKDGLSNLARVEELISMLQKLKDCIINNAGDAARQWSTVVGTLAATGSKGCLDHFVHLNGLCFLNQWLQEAQKCSIIANDGVVEELIIKLLALLEKLPINREKSNSSGVGITVEQLLGHNNLIIKERAKILFNKWKHAENTEGSCSDSEKGEKSHVEQPKALDNAHIIEEGTSSVYPVDISASKGGADEGSCKVESAGTESHQSYVTRCSDSLQKPDSVICERTCVQNPNVRSTSLISADANVTLGDANSSLSSLVSDSCLVTLSVTEESSVCPAAGLPSSGTCSSQFDREGDDQPNVSMLKDASDDDGVEEMKVNTVEKNLSESAQIEICNVPPSSSLSASASEVIAATEPTVLCNLYSNENEAHPSETVRPEPKNGGGECRMPNSLGKQVAHVTKGFQYLYGKSCIIGKLDGSVDSQQREEDVESDGGIKNLGSEVDLKVSKGVEIPCHSSKAKETKATRVPNQKSDLCLEYEIDALEVARQVAIEVEREVVDYREPFSSSPEVNSGEMTGAHSPDIEEEEQDQSMIGEMNGNNSPACEKDHSGNASSPKEDGSGITENICTDPEKPEQDLESSKLNFSVQEPPGKSGGNRCIFDLNANIAAGEFDCLAKPIHGVPVNVSAPVAVVAAPKGSPGLPVTPLHFGGELGWKGSAATSAFRPASPRRTPDGEKIYSSPKQKPNFLGIDLNVAESEDDVVIESSSVKQLPASSGLPSGDSSIEVSSRRAERLMFDLNRLGDEDAPTNLSSYSKIHPQIGDQSMSSPSSSSSRQNSMRDFDLNDHPFFDDAGGSRNFVKPPCEARGMSGGSKLKEPVITIMGARVPVERKDHASKVQHAFMGGGLNMKPGVAARAVLPYSHMPPPAYGYNGLGTGPIMSIPQAYYGPGNIPYMMDSKVPVTHVMDPGLNGAPSVRPPFLMSITNAPAGSNSYGVFHHGLDLNSGMVSVEGGGRDGGSFKQFIWQGQNGLMDEQMRTTSQPSSSSGLTPKRKQPDSGWEPSHAYGYKQVTSWQ